MSEKEEERQSQAGTEHEPNTEQDDQEEGYGDEQLEEDETYKNNHDLIGVEGIIRAQKNEIEKKKVGCTRPNDFVA